MRLKIRKSDRDGDVAVREYSIPIKGFLLKAGKLAGIYVDEGLVPVEGELPREISDDVVRGRVKRTLLVREFLKGGLARIEAYLQDGGRDWLVYRAAVNPRRLDE